MDDAFKEVLNEKTLKQLHLTLKRFPLDHLLTVLHEFIITHVSHSKQEQSKWPYVAYNYSKLASYILLLFLQLKRYSVWIFGTTRFA